ncbi:MAG TPA: hypothetical protein VIH24_07625 [Candidatus Limnocylindria bacterium]
MSDAWYVDTRNGFRLVELDPDVPNGPTGRDVRVIVDGNPVAAMPLPTADAPFAEAAFDLDGHDMLAIAYLGDDPASSAHGGSQFDLYGDGRSLTDGSPVAAARGRAVAASRASTGAFLTIESLLRIVPAASGAGIAVAVGSKVSDWGVPATLGFAAVLIGGIAVATMLASAAWGRIRAQDALDVRMRVAQGVVFTLVIYIAALVVALGIGVALLGAARQ